jgi:coenzyme F420-0:L-glutamate ligase / coenzyme F420-1:gamma-L-glutamate ligase
MVLSVLPIKTARKNEKFDLFETLLESIRNNSDTILDGDVICVSSKFVSFSQNRILELDKVIPSPNGENISKKFQIKSNFAEAIIRESDKVFGGITGFVITSSDNIMAPNAGIDKSNIQKGRIILYPIEPYLVAEQLRRKIFLDLSIHVGIIFIDSRLMPSRVGTTGVAIACAGIDPVIDMRAKKDLDGNPLKVTFQSVVDNLASIANHKMGESSESTPIVIIRDSGSKLTDRRINPSEIAISPEQCVYVRGLKSS